MHFMERLREIWPTWVSLSKSLEIPTQTAVSWGTRGIPSARFGEVMRAAEAMGHELLFEDLEATNVEIRARAAERNAA